MVAVVVVAVAVAVVVAVAVAVAVAAAVAVVESMVVGYNVAEDTRVEYTLAVSVVAVRTANLLPQGV